MINTSVKLQLQFIVVEVRFCNHSIVMIKIIFKYYLNAKEFIILIIVVFN